MNSNEAKLRRSLREKSYEPSSREISSHVAEDSTLPRRIPRDYESSIGWGNRPTSHTGPGTTHVGQACHAPHAAARRWSEQQQFCRSASARLPRTRHPAALDPDDDDYGERSSEQDSRDGERKIQQVGLLFTSSFLESSANASFVRGIAKTFRTEVLGRFLLRTVTVVTIVVKSIWIW